jgi:hypothetical protein
MLISDKQLTMRQLAQRLIQLVLGIPVHGLPQHVVDLRQIVLADTGHKVANPSAEQGMLLQCIEAKYPSILIAMCRP